MFDRDDCYQNFSCPLSPLRGFAEPFFGGNIFVAAAFSSLVDEEELIVFLFF